MADPARYVYTRILPAYVLLHRPYSFLSSDLAVQRGQVQGLPPRSLRPTPRPAFQMALPLLLRGDSPRYLLT